MKVSLTLRQYQGIFPAVSINVILSLSSAPKVQGGSRGALGPSGSSSCQHRRTLALILQEDSGVGRLIPHARRVDLRPMGIRYSNKHPLRVKGPVNLLCAELDPDQAVVNKTPNRWATQPQTGLDTPRGGGRGEFGIWEPGFGLACTQIDAPGHPQAGGGAYYDHEQHDESLPGDNGLERGKESAI